MTCRRRRELSILKATSCVMSSDSSSSDGPPPDGETVVLMVGRDSIRLCDCFSWGSSARPCVSRRDSYTDYNMYGVGMLTVSSGYCPRYHARKRRYTDHSAG